jgi:hypothetical protein
MKILIDSTKLELLLEKKRDYLRLDIWSPIGLIVSGATFSLSCLGISCFCYRLICLFFGVFLIIGGVFALVRNKLHRYTHEDLHKDINSLDEIAHRFSIIAIQDTFCKFPNRYLLKYDKRWDCNLFPYCRSTDTEEENIENIRQYLSKSLKVPAASITLEYRTKNIHPKYSYSDKVMKTYEHKLYKASILDFPSSLEQDQFQIDGIQYCWMSIEQMRNNPTIEERNGDIVKFVDSYAGSSATLTKAGDSV